MRHLFLATALTISMVQSTSVQYAQAETYSEVQARQTLTELVGNYRKYKIRAPNEIALACLGEVFTSWLDIYEISLSANIQDLKSKTEVYQEAKALSLSHKADIEQIYENLRENLLLATRSELNRARTSKEIPDIPSSMTLKEIYRDDYFSNLKECLSPRYAAVIERAAPINADFNPNRIISSNTYYQLSAGEGLGGTTVGISPSSDGPIVTTIVLLPQRMSLADWILEIRGR